MPIIPRAVLQESTANEGTPFDVTLAVADTAETLVSVPVGKKGRAISLLSEGVGSAFVAFDSVATTSDLELEKGDAYGESSLEVASSVSFIGEAGKTPRVRGILWSGI